MSLPYSKDEQRCADYLSKFGIGGGDDPIGALIVSHGMIRALTKEECANMADAAERAASALRATGCVENSPNWFRNRGAGTAARLIARDIRALP